MKPITRYQSKLLFRRSYRPKRNIPNRPAPKLNLSFRQSRAGPKAIPYECKSN